MIRQSTILAVTPLAKMLKTGNEVDNIITLANVYEVVSNVIRKVGYEYQAPLTDAEEQETICKQILKYVEEGMDAEKISAVVVGLNDTTVNLTGFTPSNIAIDLPEYTENVREHTDVLDIVTTKIAEGIRASLGVVSSLVKPILKDIDIQIRANTKTGQTIDIAMDYLRVNMVNLEPEFLSSPFCPDGIPETLSDSTTVNINDLIKGNWPTVDQDTIFDLIYLDNQTLSTFFDNRKEILEVYNQLFVYKGWWNIFDSRYRNGDVVDFTNPDHYTDFNKFRFLVIANLIANKLVSMEMPMDGVIGVSLQDYRSSLKMGLDVLTAMLYKFKVIWGNKTAAGVVILDNKVEYKAAEYGILEGSKVLQGTVQVGYNNIVLRQFSENDDASLTEYVIGYLYAKQRGYNVRDIMTDAELINNCIREYSNDIWAKQAGNKERFASNIIAEVFRKYSMMDKYETIVANLNTDIPQAGRLLDAVQTKINLPDLMHVNLVDDVADGRVSMMATQLAVTLCEIFSSEIGAEILRANARAELVSEEQQRKVLAASIIDSILKRLFNK